MGIKSIKIMTEEAIQYDSMNIDTCLHYYRDAKDPEDWLSKKLRKPAFSEIQDLKFKHCRLISDHKHSSLSEVKNIKNFYTTYKDLNDSFASDKRFWAGLTHTEYYQFSLERWGGENITAESILQHFLFKDSSALYMNILSRYWWIGRKTYREDEENPWKILDYMSQDITGFYMPLFNATWGNNRRSLDLFFNTLFECNEEFGYKATKEEFHKIRKYFTGLSAVYNSDICEDRFIIDNLKTYIKSKFLTTPKVVRVNLASETA